MKGAYRRPFVTGGVEVPDGGGRVSQLTARPLLAAFYPSLADLRQPLAGEVAAPREVLERDPVRHRLRGGDGDAARRARHGGRRTPIAQVDLGERRNFHQPLEALRPMADAVLGDRVQAAARRGPAG